MNTPKQWLPEKGVKGVGGEREGGINKGQEEIWGGEGLMDTVIILFREW